MWSVGTGVNEDADNVDNVDDTDNAYDTVGDEDEYS